MGLVPSSHVSKRWRRVRRPKVVGIVWCSGFDLGLPSWPIPKLPTTLLATFLAPFLLGRPNVVGPVRLLADGPRGNARGKKNNFIATPPSSKRRAFVTICMCIFIRKGTRCLYPSVFSSSSRGPMFKLPLLANSFCPCLCG